MTDRQIEILEMTKAGVDYYDLHGTDIGVLMYLSNEGLCYTQALSPPIYHISQKGLAVLQQLQEEAEQKAKDERQKRFDNKISVLNVVVPLLTFILGILLEHFSGIITKLISMFQSIPPT